MDKLTVCANNRVKARNDAIDILRSYAEYGNYTTQVYFRMNFTSGLISGKTLVYTIKDI